MSTQNLSDHHIFNALERQLQEHTRQQRQATLNHASELMRARGASEQDIQTALQGLHIFLQSAPTHARPDLPTRPDSSATPASTLIATTPGRLFSEIETRPTQWLWPQRIPLGKLTLLEGEAGIGTTQLALTLAAAISSGQPLPGEATNQLPSEPAHVIVISPQENASDILKPRLESAGADLSRVLLLSAIESLDSHNATLYDRPFSLVSDLDILEATITRHNARLVIIDPLSYVLQPARNSNSRRIPATSALLTRLEQLADRTACAILLVRPLNPGRSTHTTRSPHPTHLRSHDSGFPGLVASMKNILHLTHNPYHDQQLVLLSTRHTLSPAPVALAFQITSTAHSIPILSYLGETHFIPEPTLDLGHLSTGRQAILDMLETSLHPLTPIEISHATGQSDAAVRLLLKRMADSGEIGRPARGLYIAHHHRHATTTPDPIATPETSATPNPIETFDTPVVIPPATIETIETSDTPTDTPLVTPPATPETDTTGEFKNDARFERDGATFQARKPISPAASDPIATCDTTATIETIEPIATCDIPATIETTDTPITTPDPSS